MLKGELIFLAFHQSKLFRQNQKKFFEVKIIEKLLETINVIRKGE